MTEQWKIEQSVETLENFLTEEQICKAFDWTKVVLPNLRHFDRLPFIKINRSRRLYHEQSLVVWLKGRTTVLEEKSIDLRKTERLEGRARRERQREEAV